MKTMFAVFACVTGSAGCLNDGSSADVQPAKAEQPLQVPAAAISTDESCRLFMQRQRSCTETFIPALVDARVEADRPPGIAVIDQKGGRAALVKEALAEWANDSKDAAINALCDDIAQSIPPAKDVELGASISACLAIEGCEAFVSCAVPLNLIRWKD